ncbi:RNA polymerase II associated Paf1 complex [Schizosaccharomyces cryophilus OY26]|uniref:RNA polymerase II associated Paf1 complex n=1 Tax=Schizosaccharomyces cryophilus (strain OY26 / ATCC MYA-4695 / CBS 11777 / NBRC 106824 / NRRL Y48691) TaxID=653667 RepID=S9W5X7_SCHCR|nr:RNA polymerase II associated Paf1 complex [Schizosaccharomyces cryophilus OY26]EPY53969.1 RNA polymerase II associated Paf1 complex [Schizosaccharomyces cryophilus OY26]
MSEVEVNSSKEENEDLFGASEDESFTKDEVETTNNEFENEKLNENDELKDRSSDQGLFSDEDGKQEGPEQTEPVKKILESEIPNFPSPATLDAKIFHARMPNFLSVEQSPFDSEKYAVEAEADETLLEHDVQWGQRVKHKVDNTIRWRLDEAGNQESNTQVVQWSDGSYSLRIGNDIYDAQSKMITQPTFLTTSHEAQHLLRVQTAFQRSFTFLPSAISTATTSKLPSMRMRGAQLSSRGVQEIITEKDPELLKREAEKFEEERNRARRRLEKRKYLNNYKNGMEEEEEDFTSFVGPRGVYPQRDESGEQDRMDRLKRIKQEGAGEYYNNEKNYEDEEDEEALDDFIEDEEEEEEEEEEEPVNQSKHSPSKRSVSPESETHESGSASPDKRPEALSEADNESGETDNAGQRRPRRRIIESDSE